MFRAHIIIDKNRVQGGSGAEFPSWHSTSSDTSLIKRIQSQSFNMNMEQYVWYMGIARGLVDTAGFNKIIASMKFRIRLDVHA